MGIDTKRLKEKFDKKSAERVDRLNLANGENYIRILPPSIQYLTEEVDYICFSYLMHYKLGVEGDKQSVCCPKAGNKHARCPICEAVSRLYKNNTTEDKALASDIRAKKRNIFNVIDLNNPDKGIQILETGPKVLEDLIVFVTNPKWGDLLDLDTGRNITITKIDGKESDSGYTEYKVAPDPTPTSVRPQLPENFKEQIGLLQKAIPTPLSYDELKVVLEGGAPVTESKATEEPASEEQEPAPKASSNIKAGTAPVVSSKEVEPEAPLKPPVKPIEPTSLKCFGKDYGPRRPECGTCAVRVDCRAKFLEVD